MRGLAEVCIRRPVFAVMLIAAMVVVGMDGFHLANAELIRLDRRQRKGAPDTFDPGSI